MRVLVLSGDQVAGTYHARQCVAVAVAPERFTAANVEELPPWIGPCRVCAEGVRR